MITRTLRPAAVFILLAVTVGTMSAQLRSGKFGVGVAGSTYLFTGTERADKLTTFGGGFALSYSPWEVLGIRGMFGYGQLGWTNATTGLNEFTDMFSGNLYLSLDMAPNSVVNPFLLGGGGYALFLPRKTDGTYYFSSGSTDIDLQYIVGGGVDFFPSEFLSITLQGEYVMTNLKTYAGYFASETNNNSFMRVSLQVRYYFFDQDFITKLLEALKARYTGKK